MTLSNSSDFVLNANELVELAFKDLGVLAINSVLSSAQYAEGRKRLNLLWKNWRASNKFLWKTEWKTYGFTASSKVSNDGSYYECVRNHTSAAATEPGVGTEWESYWKLLAAEPSSYTAWALTTAYTSICNIALGSDVVGIGAAFLREGVNDKAIETSVSGSDYFNLGGKLSEGEPTSVYFKRMRNDNSLFVYPYPDSDSDYILNIEVYEMPEDLDSAANDLDAYQEWLDVSIKGLALDLYPQYPNSAVTYAIYKDRFNESYENAIAGDSEKGSVYCSPDLGR